MSVRILRKFAALAAFLAGISGLGTAVHAALVTVISEGAALSGPGVQYQNFDSLALGNSGGSIGPSGDGIKVSFTPDGAAVMNAVSGKYAEPYIYNSNAVPFGDNTVSGQDTTQYLTTGVGTVTLAFDKGQSYLGMLWGSVDLYNTLSFYKNGSYVGSLTGNDVIAGANGDQGLSGTRYVNINVMGGFDKVVASSGQYAFEFDNVAYAVPEPATMGMCGTALLAVTGVVLRRRKVKLAQA